MIRASGEYAESCYNKHELLHHSSRAVALTQQSSTSRIEILWGGSL
jgi:hypothetical protein